MTSRGSPVNDLEWRETADGYASDGYLIRRLEGSPQAQWLLEASNAVGASSSSAPQAMSIHSTLREAKYRACRDERQRIRRVRTSGRVVIGMAASLSYVAVSSTELALSAAGFASAMILFYVALGSFADALEVWLGDGWAREEWSRGRLTDRGLFALVNAARRRAPAGPWPDSAGAVVTLPPAP